MRVTVTGATGHIGHNLVRELVARDHSVRAVVRRRRVDLGGVEQVDGDVLDPASLERAFASAEVVFHLAGYISVSGDPGGRVTAVNVEGTRNVAEAAVRAGVRRVVHASSVHAFALRPDRVVDETSPKATGPRHTAYDRSKALGEEALRRAVDRGLDAVVVNPTGVIGPGDLGPSRMGETFLMLYRRALPSLVQGGFDWVDVRDVADGMIAAAERGARGANYLLSGHFRTMPELAAIAEEVTGVRAPRTAVPLSVARLGVPFASLWSRLSRRDALYTHESLDVLEGAPRVDRSKAERELGYRARPTAETVRDLYASFAERGLIGPLPPRSDQGAP